MKIHPAPRHSNLRRVDGWHIAGALAALLFAAASVPPLPAAQGTNSAPGRLSFSDFRIVAERNIFNPNRRAKSSGETDRRDTRRSTPRTADYVTLLGTMSYQKGPLAFFEGSRSEYKKTINPGDKIAGFGVTAIEANRVMLNAGTNWLELPVGKQLRREEEGEWRVADAPERQITSYTSSSSSSSSGSSYSRPSYSSSSTPTPPTGFVPPPPGPEGAAPLIMIDPNTGAVVAQPPDQQQTNGAPAAASPGDPNDVLRRLMQRREEEMNR